MAENKLPNNNEIENEKQKLQQEIKRLDIYKNCNNYYPSLLVCYFPNKATEIEGCLCKKEDENYKWYVLKPDAKEQLQNIIMDELCSLFEPYIKKGFKVKQLDGDLYHSDDQNFLICLNTHKNDKNISISIGEQSKSVFTNGEWQSDIDECKGNASKLCLFPNSGIQINHNYKDNKFHNEIEIFDYDIDYTLIINPDTKTIKLTDFDEKTECATFRDEKNDIFKNKEDIIPFFSKLSFAEIEQVLQILNKHLKDQDRKNFNIKTVLSEIKNTIEKNRKEEKKNEEKGINNKNNIIENELITEKNNENDKIETKKNDNVFVNGQFEKNTSSISCDDCIACLKQCCGCDKGRNGSG